MTVAKLKPLPDEVLKEADAMFGDWFDDVLGRAKELQAGIEKEAPRLKRGALADIATQQVMRRAFVEMAGRFAMHQRDMKIQLADMNFQLARLTNHMNEMRGRDDG